jgi:hypothetical protein
MTKKSSTEPTADTTDIYDYLPHPLAEEYPLMEGEEFELLVKDIEDNGLIEAIILHEGKILDGRNRYNACRKIKFKFGSKDFRNLPSDKDPLLFVESKNWHRRHLTQEQKRDRITKLLVQRPNVSDRLIASIARVSHHTVADVRRKLVGEPDPATTDPAPDNSTGQIAQLEKPATTTRTGADGKTRTTTVSTGKTKTTKPLKLIKENLELLTDAASQREVFLMIFDTVLTRYHIQKVNRWLRTHKECVIRFLDDDDEPKAPPAEYADDDDAEQPGASY